VNPTARVRVGAPDTVICNTGSVTISARNPNIPIRGTWKYDLTVVKDSHISGTITGNKTVTANNSSLTDVLDNDDTIKHKVSYTYHPYISNDDGTPSVCAQFKDTTITVWVNPTAKLYIYTPDTILCDSTTFTISVRDGNGNVLGTKVYQLTTYQSGGITGIQPNYEYSAAYSFSNKLINTTNSVQNVTYNFKARIKDRPEHIGTYCDQGKDTSVTIYVNPTPKMSISTIDTVFCDSTSVNFTLTSLNGNIIGDKYYQITTTFDTAKVKVYNAKNDTLPIKDFSNQLINKTTSLGTIYYDIVPVFRNPRKNDTTEFCSVGKPIHFKRYVLPVLKAILIDTSYAGGLNNTIKCKGDNTGKITAKISGGLTVYPYSQPQDSCIFIWSNKWTKRINPKLKAGFYNLAVTDRHVCKTTAKDTLKDPPKLIARDTILQGFKCSSATKGKMLAKPTGGTTPYDYEWDVSDSRNFVLHKDTVGELIEGIQFLKIIDANGCRDSTKDILYKESIPQSAMEVSQYGKYNISCYGKSDGYFYPSIPTEGANLIYTWARIEKNGTLTQLKSSSKDPYLENYPKGLYSFTLNNPDLKCSSQPTRDSLIEPNPIGVSAQLSTFYNNQYNLSCDNRKDGKISLTVKGGHESYNFKWKTFGRDTIETRDSVINNLDSGKYYLTIVDSAKIKDTNPAEFKYCYKYSSESLTKPIPLKLDTILSHKSNWNVSCYNSSDGFIKAKITGGVAPYSYNWKNSNLNTIFPDSNVITSLPADTYKLGVTYGKGCKTNWKLALVQPVPLDISLKLKDYSGYNISCSGDSNGAAKAIVAGGANYYKYYWHISSEDTSKSFSIIDSAKRLKALQQYVFEVKDANNCIAKKNFALTQPLELNGYIESVNLSCKLRNNGLAFVIPNGGVSPYTYIWSIGATTDSIKNLAVGEYSVQITDTNNCTKQLSVTINSPDSLKGRIDVITEAQYHKKGVSCYGFSDAVLAAADSGGTKPYHYQWNVSNIDTITISGISAGKVEVLVIDTKGCSGKDTITVSQPQPLAIQISKQNISCYGFADGKYTALINGGTRPYSYLWTNGQKDSIAKNLRAGTDTVKVYDANNCFIELSDTLTQPKPLKSRFVSSKMPYCPATKDGAVKALGEGGTLPYKFLWSNGKSDSIIENILEGEYVLTLVDSNKCTYSDSIKLKAIHGACLDVPKAFTPNGDSRNDTWNILVGDPTSPVVLGVLYPEAIVQVYNRWGEVIYQSEKGYKHEWDGTYKGRVMAMDSYYYSIDLGNGTEKFIGIVSIIR
jgi:gliding motility-associated-like protein